MTCFVSEFDWSLRIVCMPRWLSPAGRSCRRTLPTDSADGPSAGRLGSRALPAPGGDVALVDTEQPVFHAARPDTRPAALLHRGLGSLQGNAWVDVMGPGPRSDAERPPVGGPAAPGQAVGRRGLPGVFGQEGSWWRSAAPAGEGATCSWPPPLSRTTCRAPPSLGPRSPLSLGAFPVLCPDEELSWPGPRCLPAW